MSHVPWFYAIAIRNPKHRPQGSSPAPLVDEMEVPALELVIVTALAVSPSNFSFRRLHLPLLLSERLDLVLGEGSGVGRRVGNWGTMKFHPDSDESTTSL